MLDKTRIGDLAASAVLPTNLLCHLVQRAVARGLDPMAWFKGLHLEQKDIDDPGTRISHRQASTFIQRALATLATPELGLLIGRQQNLGNFGLAGLAMKTSATLGEALAIGMRFQQMTGALLEVSVDDGAGDEVTMLARARQTPDALLPFLCEELFASSLMAARELLADDFVPLRLELGYAEPAYAEAYRALFRCPIRFGSPRNALVIAREWLATPFPTHNPVTARQVLELCERQLAALPEECGETTAEVERYLRQHLHQNPSLASLAKAMHVSERTLRRHLAAESASFSTLHDRIRTEHALELLQDRGLSIIHVGSRVGFHDAREFRRAFKRWTGQTPRQARDLPLT